MAAKVCVLSQEYLVNCLLFNLTAEDTYRNTSLICRFAKRFKLDPDRLLDLLNDYGTRAGDRLH